MYHVKNFFMLFAAVFALAGANAQEHSLGKLTPQERRAFAEASSIRFIVATLKKCDQIRERARELAASTIIQTTDGRGRVTSMRYGTVDIVVEYANESSRQPDAIIGLGVRIPMQPGRQFDADSLGALKARAIMYREVRELCGLPRVSKSSEATLTPAYIDEGDIYTNPDYFDVGYWEAYWEPAYFYGIPSFAPNAQCITVCQEQCDIINDVAQVACGVMGTAFGVANPGLGILLGATCALGSLGNKYECRNVGCVRECTPR